MLLLKPTSWVWYDSLGNSPDLISPGWTVLEMDLRVFSSHILIELANILPLLCEYFYLLRTQK